MEKSIIKNFESSITRVIEQALIDKAKDVVRWSNTHIDTSELFLKAYKNIDFEKVQAEITEKLQNIMAEHIVASVTTEFGRDVKAMLSNAIIRNDLKEWLQIQAGDLLKKINEQEA